MKLLILFLALAQCALPLAAQTNADPYAVYGRIFTVKLDSAPFPHPDRAQGHKYHEKLFTAEKNYSDNTVAIYVPKGFKPGKQIDFVVHFHGWNNHVSKVLTQYQLVNQFFQAGRNAILVVPQGPLDAQDSFDGKLEDENGFKRFMGDVMTVLQTNKVIKSQPVGDIVLSGHSGGYQVISSIVEHGGMSEQVKEVWLFDALYARTEKYMAWYKKFPNRRLINFYTQDGGTLKETQLLMASLKQPPETPFLAKDEADVTDADLRNNHLVFIFTPLPHDETPYQHQDFFRFLNTSSLPPLK